MDGQDGWDRKDSSSWGGSCESRLKGSTGTQHPLAWWQSLHLSPNSPLYEHCHLGFFIYIGEMGFLSLFYGSIPKLMKGLSLVIFGMVGLKVQAMGCVSVTLVTSGGESAPVWPPYCGEAQTY